MTFKLEILQGHEQVILRDGSGEEVEGLSVVGVKWTTEGRRLILETSDFEIDFLPNTPPSDGDLWIMPDPFLGSSTLGFGAVVREHEAALKVPPNVYKALSDHHIRKASSLVKKLLSQPGLIASALGITKEEEAEHTEFLLGVLEGRV